MKCFLPVKEMDGIFCGNLCEPRGGFPPCWSAWHAKCYECLGIGVFPVNVRADVIGNTWYQQADREFAMNHGMAGVHAFIPFQCEKCWMVNLE